MSFYTVYSPQGEAPAKVQHNTHGEALFAARRMAALHPEQDFFVMKSASKRVAVASDAVGTEAQA